MDFGIVSYIGDISDVPLGELLFSLRMQEENGMLFLRRDKVAKKLLFHQGRLTHLASSLSRESLIRKLLTKGIISQKKSADLVEQAEKEQKPVLQLLFEDGNIPSETLDESSREIALESLIEIFSWEEGQYAFFFDRTEDALFDAVPVSISMEQIIYNGILKGYSKYRLIDFVLDDLDLAWNLTGEISQIKASLDLDQHQLKVLKNLNGKHTLERVAYGSHLELHPTLALILTMKTLRLVSAGESDDLADLQEALPKDSGLNIDEINYAQRLIQTGPAILSIPPFELLQISRNFSDTDLRKGYYSLAQRYHQREIIDKLPPAVRQLSNKIFDRISHFFEALLKLEKSRQDKSLEVFEELDNQLFAHPHQRARAQLSFMTGRGHFIDKKYDQAIAHFDQACLDAPNEGEYRTYLGFSYAMKSNGDDPLDLSKAFQEIRKSGTLDSRFAMTYFSLGRCLEFQGKVKGAHAQYKQGLLIAPEDEELIQAVRRTLPPFEVEVESDEKKDAAQFREIEQKLKTFLIESESKNYFELLGVGENISSSNLRRAYFSMAKEFHPDRLGTLKDHPMAEEVFSKINEAYDVLSNEKKRRFYERSLRTREREAEFKQSQKKIETTKLFSKAEALLHASKHDQAFETFKEIDRKRGDCPECKAYMGYCLFLRDFKTNPRIYIQAEEYFEKSEEIAEEQTLVHLLRGKMYRMMEKNEKAMRSFRIVLEMDEDNVDALREIRLINARRISMQDKEPETKTKITKAPAEPEKKGLLGSLFGKKK